MWADKMEICSLRSIRKQSLPILGSDEYSCRNSDRGTLVPVARRRLLPSVTYEVHPGSVVTDHLVPLFIAVGKPTKLGRNREDE
jgi:hypothetical protein